MKIVFVVTLLFAGLSQAARIGGARWNSETNSIQVKMLFQGGCLPHNFTVQWDRCEFDPIKKQNVRSGQVLDTGWQDTCAEELEKFVVFSEPTDGCRADVLLLKATSSKEPYLVEKSEF